MNEPSQAPSKRQAMLRLPDLQKPRTEDDCDLVLLRLFHPGEKKASSSVNLARMNTTRITISKGSYIEVNKSCR